MDNNQMNSHGTGRPNMDMNANNYRTNAATDGNKSNWGWLGLLGLTGLFGLRSRDRDRT
nr:WGxxGxxG family protein [Paenibacillus sp. UNC451MF]